MLASARSGLALVVNDEFKGTGITVVSGVTADDLSNGVDSGNLLDAVVSLDKGACTGTLINSRTVLTAAHCMFKSGGVIDPVTQVGITSKGSSVPSTVYTPAMIVVYPRYDKRGTSAADIALVILPQAITTATAVNLLTLQPGDAGFPGKGTPILITGFGKHGTGSDPPDKKSEDDNNRRIAQTTLGDYRALNSLPGVTGTQMAFAAQFRDPKNSGTYDYFSFTPGQARLTSAEGGNAPGDSGSPVFYCPKAGGTGCAVSELVLIGVLIGGDQPGTGKDSGYGEVNVWTPANLFRSWIDANNGTLAVTAKPGPNAWGSPGAWSGGALPTAASLAWLNDAATLTVKADAAAGALWLGHAQASLTIEAGRTLAVASQTMINSGSMMVAGTLTTPLFGMTGGGLRGTGTIDTSGGIVANYAGTVAPGGAAIGTLTVKGDYLQGPSATLLIRTGGVGSDRLTVTGTATLDGTLKIDLEAQGRPLQGTRTDTIVSGASVVSPNKDMFATVTSTSSAFLTVTTTSSSTAVRLTTERKKPYASAATTPNTQTLAARFDAAVPRTNLRADTNQFLSDLDLATATAAQDAFSRIVADGPSGEDNDVVGNQLLVNLAAARLIQVSLDQHLAALRDGTAVAVNAAAGLRQLDLAFASRTGFDLGTGLPGSAGLPDTVSVAAEGPVVASAVPVWLHALGGWQRLATDGNAMGLKQRTAGVIGGVDLEGLADRVPGLMTGIAFAYTRSALGGDGESGTTDGWRVSAYGTYGLGPFFIGGHLTWGATRMTTTRWLEVLDYDRTASGSASGAEWSAALEAGSRLVVGRMVVEPSAGLSWVRVTRLGFAETGAGLFDLATEDSALDSLRVSAGFRSRLDLAAGPGWVLQPELRARWLYDLRDVMPVTTATLEGLPGDPFSFDGVGIGRHAALLGAGVTIAKADQVALFADYTAELRRFETVQSARGGFRFRW